MINLQFYWTQRASSRYKTMITRLLGGRNKKVSWETVSARVCSAYRRRALLQPFTTRVKSRNLTAGAFVNIHSHCRSHCLEEALKSFRLIPSLTNGLVANKSARNKANLGGRAVENFRRRFIRWKLSNLASKPWKWSTRSWSCRGGIQNSELLRASRALSKIKDSGKRKREKKKEGKNTKKFVLRPRKESGKLEGWRGVLTEPN